MWGVEEGQVEEAEVSYWKLLVELKATGVLKKRFSCDEEGPRVLKNLSASGCRFGMVYFSSTSTDSHDISGRPRG